MSSKSSLKSDPKISRAYFWVTPGSDPGSTFSMVQKHRFRLTRLAEDGESRRVSRNDSGDGSVDSPIKSGNDSGGETKICYTEMIMSY